jgi:hypothetical protein
MDPGDVSRTVAEELEALPEHPRSLQRTAQLVGPLAAFLDGI